MDLFADPDHERDQSTSPHRLSELFLYPVTGLYNECHSIDYASLINAEKPLANSPHGLMNLNNLWWRRATSHDTLQAIVDKLQKRYAHGRPDTKSAMSVLANPDLFIQKVHEAVKGISNLAAGPVKLFSYLETMQIFCSLYSDFISHPHTLSLQEGLLTSELSSDILFKEALDPKRNPYLSFIEENAVPVVQSISPQLVWLVGPIKTSLITMAMFARKANPQCHISVIGHSSEYYSLNKIDHLLKRNDILFSLIDSIVLDDFEHTIPQLRDALTHGDDLSSVPNIMFKGKDGRIIQNKYAVNNTKSLSFNSSIHETNYIGNTESNSWTDAGSVVTAKLWPNTKCFWSSCNFCAINKKYNTLPVNDFSDASAAHEFLKGIVTSGKSLLWSIDEAIPPQNLGELANLIIESGLQIHWETRSKVHSGFTQEICNALYNAGLREIRLGLESASPRVLEAMGKHPEGWSLSLVEEVVSRFHAAGISVHFPVIVGFPTETQRERQETYDFLTYIVGKYPSVTFNINILGLDVGSKLFQKYEMFGITEIRWPSDPKFFLGNLLDWNSLVEPFNYDFLDSSRNRAMRELLYPWMPETAELPVFIFYRLAETSRATLVWKQVREERRDWRLSQFDEVGEVTQLSLSSGLVVYPLGATTKLTSQARYFLYDWNSHHQLEVDDDGLATINALREPKSLAEFRELAKDLPILNELRGLGIVAAA